MTPKTPITTAILFDQFDQLITRAGDIPRLNELILQLAVRGLLVPQNPADEPAADLLKRIKAEKARLVKAGELRPSKPLPPIKADEIPFDLPPGWEWVKLDDICSYIQRGRSPTYSEVKKYPVVAQKCIQWHGFEMFKAKFIDPDTLPKYGEERILKTGDILWNSTGRGTLGRLIVYDEDFNEYELAVADSHVTVVRSFKEHIDSWFLFYWLASPAVQNEIENT